MNILHTIFSASREAGGTTEALRQMCLGLAKAGHTSEIATLEASHSNPDLEAIPMYPLGFENGSYRFSLNFLNWVKENQKRFDAIICHGLWQFHLLGTRLALHTHSTPYFVYPHGMLDPWFKKQYPKKHLKKSIYWKLFEHTNLSRAKSLLFTCEQEKFLARETFTPYQIKESVCPLGLETPDLNKSQQCKAFLDTFPHLKNKKFFLFLSRIHPKKGVDLLIRSYDKLAHKLSNDLPDLVIAGPSSDDSTLQQLKEQAKQSDSASKIHFLPMLTGDVKWGSFQSCYCFILPSHQENFGIVVVEALACQKAVLISKQVNIWKEIESHKAGLVFDNNEDEIYKAMLSWHTLDSHEQENMNQSALTLFHNKFSLHKATQTLINNITSQN